MRVGRAPQARPALAPPIKIIWIIIRARQNSRRRPAAAWTFLDQQAPQSGFATLEQLLNHRIFWSKYGEGDENVPFLHRSATSSSLLKMTK